jgi:protein-tyrosine phosphatase
MAGIIDFHSHVLPGIDDGSHSLEESIAMLRMEAEQGVRHVIATPHFYPQHDTPDHFLQKRREAEKLLREEMEKYSDLPILIVGAEVYYFPGISNSEAMAELTIDKKKCILIEMPTPPWTDAMYRELEGLYTKQGLIPIVAHVDRYIGRFRTFGIPKRLAELPVLVQANAEFFLEKPTSSMALRMLKRNEIHLLGSDCHNLDARKPNLRAALDLIERRMGADPLAAIQKFQAYALQNE